MFIRQVESSRIPELPKLRESKNNRRVIPSRLYGYLKGE